MFLDKFKKNLPILVFLAFLVFGFAVYFNSFGNEFFWDDEDLITKNAYVRSFQVDKFFSENEIAGVGQISNYWRPLLLISFALDYKLWGLHPVGFHMTNTLLHVANAWLLFFIFGHLLSRRLKDGRGHLLSFLASSMFLIHPLQTEAVTYVAGRGDPLSALLSLFTIGAYVLFREKSKLWFLVASSVFFAAGLLVKEQVVFLPLLLILVEFVFYGDGRLRTDVVVWFKRLWPFFSLSAVYVVSRLTFLNFNDLLSGISGQGGEYYESGPFVRVLTFSSVMLSYLRLLFVPTGLHMAREVEPVVSIVSWSVAIFFVLVAGLSFLAAKAWKKDRIVAFGLLWFVVILLPRTNIIAINRPMYEHWLYLPMFGFWLAVFSASTLLYERLRSVDTRKVIKVLGVVVLILSFSLFSFLTVSRNSDWRDPVTFYEKNLTYTPDSYIQRNNLAMAYADSGRHLEAIEQYRRAIAIADIYPQVHYNLGNSLSAVGSLSEALKEYRRAIDISPEFMNPYINMVSILDGLGRKGEAEEVLAEAQGFFAGSVDFWYFKGMVYYRWREYETSLAALKKASELAPGDLEVSSAVKAVSLKIGK